MIISPRGSDKTLEIRKGYPVAKKGEPTINFCKKGEPSLH